MTDEQLSATITRAVQEARAQFEVVVERLEGKIDLTVEALHLLNGKVDRRSDAIEHEVRAS